MSDDVMLMYERVKELDALTDLQLMRRYVNTLAEWQDYVRDRAVSLIACDPALDERIEGLALLNEHIRKRGLRSSLARYALK